jgi:hypothetical protein
VKASSRDRNVGATVSMGGGDRKRQRHARESGHPDLAVLAKALDSRFRGNDTMLNDLIWSDATH